MFVLHKNMFRIPISLYGIWQQGSKNHNVALYLKSLYSTLYYILMEC